MNFETTTTTATWSRRIHIDDAACPTNNPNQTLLVRNMQSQTTNVQKQTANRQKQTTNRLRRRTKKTCTITVAEQPRTWSLGMVPSSCVTNGTVDHRVRIWFGWCLLRWFNWFQYIIINMALLNWVLLHRYSCLRMNILMLGVLTVCKHTHTLFEACNLISKRPSSL